MSGPGIVSILADLAGSAAGKAVDKVGAVANTLNDSGQYGADNSATVPLAPDATGQAGTNAANALPQSGDLAKKGVEGAAKTQEDLVTPVGNAVKNAGLTEQQRGINVQQDAIDEYRNAVQDTHQKTYDVQNAIRDANDAANIDPNVYLSKMGVGQKTLTSIGMLLSGIGSGLTGQPNMAMQVLQTNIQRDIEAQKNVFLNKMTVAAHEKGLLQSAKDRQQLAQAALQGATIVVGQGANTAITGVQAQTTGATSQQVAQQTKNMIDQKTAQALSDYNANYIKTVKSGNTKNVKLAGIAADTVAEHFGKGPIGLNKNPLGAAEAAQPDNAILNGKSQQNQQQDLGNILQKESNSRTQSTKTNKPTFLDALSQAGSQ